MKLLNKLTIKNLKLNKKRTIVTVIGIILSVALLTAVASMFFSARESLIAFEKQEQGNFHIGFENVPAEDLRGFELNRKIEEIFVTENIGYAKLDGIQNEYKPYVFVKAFAEESMENLAVNLIEGRLPENENEILVPSHLKTNGGVKLNVGETISIDVGTRVSDGVELNQGNPFEPSITEEIINAEAQEYKIVGIMERASGIIEGYSAPGYTFVTYLNEVEAAGNINVYVRYTKDGVRNYEDVTSGIVEDNLNPKYDYQYNSYLISLETGILNDSTLTALATAAMVVVFIIIFTSVFCIKNSFDISITEKIRQYGMLSSIGATKKQIKQNVYYEAFILGCIGMPLGILSGIFAAFVLIQVSNFFLEGTWEVELIFSFSWLAVLFAILLGFLTLFLSARRSAGKASKIAPIQAIRNSDEIKINAKKVKSPKWVSKIFGIGGDISYKNLQRSKKKYRTTVISITVCVAVFISLSSFINLAFDVLKVEFQSTDYNLSGFFVYEEGMQEKIDQIPELTGVNSFSCIELTSLEFQTDRYSEEYLEIFPNAADTKAGLTMHVLNNNAFRDYVEELNLDYEEVKEKGILLNTVYMSVQEEGENPVLKEMPQFTYEVGEKIEGQVNLRYEEEENNKSINVSIEIAEITEEMPMGVYGFTSAASMIISEELGEGLVNQNHRQYIYIDSDDASKTQEELEVLFEDYSVSIFNEEEEVRMMQSFFTLVAIFLYGFITVIALIGITNIFNTITTNMNLRRREFAMLKSVGMTKKEFNRMIQLESFFYGMKSLIIGIPIGCIVSYMIYGLLMDGEVILQYRLPVSAIIISMAAVFLLITLIMRYSIRKINKQNIIETIRNENI